jgi:Ino eighty subunit 2
MDTINKLLKKPAPKRRTRAEIIAQQHADAMGTPGLEDGEEERPDPLYVRWVNGREGSRIGVPEEWLEAPVGEMLGRVGGGFGGGRMVEEVV